MTPRELATKEILYFIDRISPGSKNREIYEERLAKMSNAQFARFIESLENEEEILSLFEPNLKDSQVSVMNNLEVGKELGHEFFHHLLLTDPHTGQVVRTPVKHMVIDLPLRRQAEMLQTKMSVPEHNKAIDERSDQPTGPSKGARLSYPEIQVNAAKGLDNSVLELIKYRGGDTKAYNAMNRSILETGEASLEEIKAKGPTTVKSKQTLAVYLKAMMIDPENL